MTKAGEWATRTAREGFRIPVPQSLLDHLTGKVDDPTVRDLSLTTDSDDRLHLSGLKKKGVWVAFAAEFRLASPGETDPPQSLVLELEKAEPFFARKALMSALSGIEGVTVSGERVLVDLGELIARSDWGSRIPEGLRERLRIREVTTAEGQLQVRVALA